MVKNYLITAFLLLFFGTHSFAQNEDNWAAALKFSSKGVGIEGAYSLNPKFSLRLGLNYLQFEQTVETDVSGDAVEADVGVDMNSIDVLVDWYPFESSSFRFTGGFAYNLSYQFDARVQPLETYTYGDFIEITPDVLGDLTITTTYNKFNPYLGMGFGRAVPNKRVGFGVEMGAFYTGAPKVDLTATGLLKPTEDQGPQLEEDLSTLTLYPLVMFRVAFRLTDK